MEPTGAPLEPLPSPIPWLGQAGEVAPLDRVAATAPAQAVSAPKPAVKRAPKKKKLPGSGIPARKVIRGLVWARRVAQASFFALFAFFLSVFLTQ